MLSSRSPFYITTAIDYPNGQPHLGHAYEKLVTDAYARWARQLGKDVFFLTGTDENGQKLVKSAQDAGIATEQFVRDNSENFREFAELLQISNDGFIQTTESRHHRAATQIWTRLLERGFIEFGTYEGYYCLSCEAFYPDNQAPDRICPNHHKPLMFQKEDGYFLRLSRAQAWLRQMHSENPLFLRPEVVRKEIVSRLHQEDLRDLSISRLNQGWGIPVPGDEKFVMYTWFDALINYYTETVESSSARTPVWPAQLHVIGRDIAWFHTVIWPAMLHFADLPLPSQVYVHGMILDSDGRKMSKSLGNGVDPYELLQVVPLESFRYYVLKTISASGDGKFSVQELIDKHNSELANDLGNLLMRITKFAIKRGCPIVERPSDLVDLFDVRGTIMQIDEAMEAREHHLALEALWVMIRGSNQWVTEQAPWKIKEDPEKLQKLLYQSLERLFWVAELLEPFMPRIAKSMQAALGVSRDPSQSKARRASAPLRFVCSEPPMLFPKIEPEQTSQ